jgi:hypothetical protein
MNATFQNSSMVLSIGIFFSLIITGLSASLPSSLLHGLTAQGVPAPAAESVSHLPPSAVMFASLLGYNPIRMLLGSTLSHLPASSQAYLTGHSFFPSLISAPFEHGLQIAFGFSIACCLIAALASLLRGKRYVHDVHAAPGEPGMPAPNGPATGDLPQGRPALRAAASWSTVSGGAAPRGTASSGAAPPGTGLYDPDLRGTALGGRPGSR